MHVFKIFFNKYKLIFYPKYVAILYSKYSKMVSETNDTDSSVGVSILEKKVWWMFHKAIFIGFSGIF